MRSRLVRISSRILALLLGLALGFGAITEIAPQRLREVAELSLEQHFGPVDVASARATLAWGPAFELTGVRTDGRPGAPGLEARSVTVTLGLRALLRGRVELRRLAVEGLELRVARDADGVWSPAILRTLTEPSERSDGSGSLPRIVVDGARVLLSDARYPGTLRVEGLHLLVAESRLGGGLRVSSRGGVYSDEGIGRGRFDLEAHLEADQRRKVELALTHLDLATVLRWLGADAHVEGRASGYLTWQQEGAPPAFDAEFLLLDPRWSGEGDPIALADPASPSLRLAGAGRIDAKHVEITALDASSGAFRLQGSGEAARPLGRLGVLSFDLRAGPIPIRAALDAAGIGDGVVQGGELADLRVRQSGTSIAEWAALFDAPLDAWPDRLAVASSLANVSLRIGEQQTIRVPRAEVELDGGRARLVCEGASLEGEPLPQLDVDLGNPTGWLQALKSKPPRSVAPQPGWFALRDWIDAQRKPGQPSKWELIDIDADWLHHPALLRPIEAAHFTVTPAGEGVFLFTMERGRFGGVPVEGAGLMGRERIDLQFRAETMPAGAPRPDPRTADPGVWFRARFAAQIRALGKVKAERVSGRLRAGGQHVDVTGAEVWLLPRGQITGQLNVDFTRREFVPYRARFQLVDGSVPDLMRDLELSDGEDVTGDVVLAADLKGQAQAHQPLLAELRGPTSLHARNGEIRQRMPMIMAIAAVSDTFNPFQSRETLEYGGIDAELTFDGGVLRSDSAALEGPALRMVATGSIHLLEKPLQVEAVVGLFFFRTLDRVLSALPLLNTFLLGSDENLVGAYFAIQGPWGDPEAKLIPTKSLATGPASFVLEGVPNFVKSGLGQLARLFSPRASPSEGAQNGNPAVDEPIVPTPRLLDDAAGALP